MDRETTHRPSFATVEVTYDSGDHPHPGDAGYRATTYAIDLSLFSGESDA